LKTGNNGYDFLENGVEDTKSQGGLSINFMRVLGRAIRFWYFIVLSLIAGVVIAYVVNRYSTRTYAVRASIIVKENEENVGSKFLYNNELLNPYRNFYNEIYIMRSYPLLQEVMESLNFDVTMYREGDIKTTEYYDPTFPVKFSVHGVKKNAYGKSFYFHVKGMDRYSFQEVKNEKSENKKEFDNLTFGDTITIRDMRVLVQKVGNLSSIKNDTYIIKFTDPFTLAREYSAKLMANWASLGASVVNLEVIGTSSQKEIDFLNKFIERYQNYDVEKKNRVATMAMRFLDEQLIIIRDSLKMYEDQVDEFKNRNIIVNLGEETNRLYMKMQGLEDQKFRYKLAENYYSYIAGLLKNDNYDGIFTPSSVGVSDDVVAGLIKGLIDLQTQVNMYKSHGTRGVEKLNENPRLEEKLREIAYVKNDILKTIQNSRETQKINIGFINDQIALVEGRLSRLPKTERELVNIKRNYSLKESLYVFLLQKKTEAGLSKASTTSDIVLVNPPLAGSAITPDVMFNYSIGALSGFVIPILVFLLLEILNTRVQSKEDIERMTSVPVICGVGHNPATDALVVYKKPRSAMAESFRALRSNLNYFTSNREHQVFMVSSSIPGEGKSFTTLNLATVFALAGKKTLILGADLRKPKLFDELGLSNDIGLSQYLSGMALYEQILQPTSVENLYFISGGPMPPNPSELLIRPLMAELMDRLRLEFDFVIMDTPPVAYVTDAFALSPLVDHTLYVVRQDFTPKSVLTFLDENYRSGKLPRISILFNDLRKSGMCYGYV
jgi:capsular exopolysaccharide synthesis family protein